MVLIHEYILRLTLNPYNKKAEYKSPREWGKFKLFKILMLLLLPIAYDVVSILRRHQVLVSLLLNGEG